MSPGKSNNDLFASIQGSAWQAWPLADARLELCQGWLEESVETALFQRLRAELPWSVHRIRMFGRMLDSPRLSCWIGDPNARYRYSGVDFEPHPWPESLSRVRERLSDALGQDFNSVLANCYRHGQDAMGWHSDDEPELGAQPLIASLSLGASRRFLVRRRGQPSSRIAITLEPGSLLLMGGDMQRHWQHALPRTARPVGERINLTFRWIRPRC